MLRDNPHFKILFTMAKLTKKRKESLTKLDTEKLYTLKEASDVVKSFSKLKFDSSVELRVAGECARVRECNSAGCCALGWRSNYFAASFLR